MRRFVSLFWCLSVLVLLSACGGDQPNDQTTSSSASSSGVRPGKVRSVEPTPVPDLTLETMGGESIDLRAQKGRALLINFWATWCAPCLREIPDLKALNNDLNSDGLTIIGVALDRKGREVVAPFVENDPSTTRSSSTVRERLNRHSAPSPASPPQFSLPQKARSPSASLASSPRRR